MWRRASFMHDADLSSGVTENHPTMTTDDCVANSDS